MHDRQLCPRRAETGQPIGPEQKQLDDWYKREGVRHCSYCGSVHPDDFMTHARTGTAEFGPTDKNYKVYVEDPKVLHQPTRGCSGDVDANGRIIMRPFGKKTVAQQKFYFQHLSEDQMREFLDLYNARPKRDYSADDMSYTGGDGDGMQVGYPGYFYALPFFMRRQHA